MVRATVRASQAKARATRAAHGHRGRRRDHRPVARVLVDVPLAHLDRPFDYRCPPRWPRPRCRAPGSRCASPPGRRRVRRRPRRDHRAQRAAGQPAPGRQPRARAHPRDRGAHRRRGAALRRHPLGRAAPRGPRPARHRREGALAPRARVAPFDGRAAAEAGATTSRARPSSGTWPTAEPRAVWGAAPGTDWPHLLAHAAAARTPAVAARCSASPTARTSPASTARSRRCWATATTSR